MAEMTTQTVAPALPRAQNRVLKNSSPIKARSLARQWWGSLCWWRCWRRGLPRSTRSKPTSAVRKAPSAMYWFGTDELGRDILSRIIWGAHLADGGLYVCGDCRGYRRTAGAGGGLLPEDVGRRHLARDRGAAGLPVPDHGDRAGAFWARA